MFSKADSYLELEITMDTTEVCVVGAGPSGLALGIALAQQGVKVRLA